MDPGHTAGAEKKQRRPTGHESSSSESGASADEIDRAAHVLSLSARDAPGASGTPGIQTAATRSGDVFLTPRVIDQIAFNDLSASLRSLIEDANAAAASLEQTMRQAAQAGQQSTTASALIQERLSLGARMLKAFQIQMDQAQTTSDRHSPGPDPAASMEHRITELSDQFMARIEGELEKAQLRLGQMTKDSLAAFDRALTGRSDDAGGIERTVSEAGVRAEALVKVVESAEVNIAALAHNAAQSVVKAQADALLAKGLIGQAQLARQQLGQSLLESTERLDEAADRADHIGRLAQDVRSRVDRQMRALAEVMHEVATRMEEALARGGAVDERPDEASAAPAAGSPVIETSRPPRSSQAVATPVGSRRGWSERKNSPQRNRDTEKETTDPGAPGQMNRLC